MENQWQLCPKCLGENYYFNGCLCVNCGVCNGEKIISTLTGKPPSAYTSIKDLSSGIEFNDKLKD